MIYGIYNPPYIILLTTDWENLNLLMKRNPVPDNAQTNREGFKEHTYLFKPKTKHPQLLFRNQLYESKFDACSVQYIQINKTAKPLKTQTDNTL